MAARKRVLVIDNEEGICRMVEAVLADGGYEVGVSTQPLEAVAAFAPGRWDLVITDVKMPGLDGLEVLRRVRELDPVVPVVMITAYATVEMSIQALRRGAYDIITKPFEPEELLHRVGNALSQTRLLEENRSLREELGGEFRFDNIVGAATGLKDVLEKVKKVAVRDLSVLITGESGTGKELIAQAIHHNSPRRAGRFVAINCAALPASLLESELFGFRRGAFTGAKEDRQGLLEAADGGTVFLDEVGNLPLDVQKTLLRFLQEREFLRIGDAAPRKVDVRIISATNADLKAATRAGAFREDLYYRLNAVTLHLPPLRERSSDIPLLAAHFVRRQNAKFGTAVRGFTPEALAVLSAYAWPGNIRELRNVVEGCLALESGDLVGQAVLAQFIEVPGGARDGSAEVPGELPAVAEEGEDGGEGGFASAASRFEAEYFRSLLRKTRGNVEVAAAEAGLNLATLYRKIKKHGIRKEDLA
ncbi:MAG TPA: sigma-54 dependent transcriptional regulator [bacterium]